MLSRITSHADRSPMSTVRRIFSTNIEDENVGGNDRGNETTKLSVSSDQQLILHARMSQYAPCP